MMKISLYPDIPLVFNNQSLQMPWMMGGGQPIPADLSYPLPKTLLLLLIALTIINGYVYKIQILPGTL